MIFAYLLTALTVLLALAAHRWPVAAALGMAAGAALLLAALVVGTPTRTLLLCLLVPCVAALWPKGGRP